MRVGCRCGRAKGRCEQAAPVGRKRAASQEALIAIPGKTVLGELRGETSGTFNCGAQGRACRQWAGLGIGSLGTVFFFGVFLRASTLDLSKAPGFTLKA